MIADDILARVRRVDHLLRDLMLEIPNAEKADHSINAERTEYLSTLRRALADVEKALVVSAMQPAREVNAVARPQRDGDVDEIVALKAVGYWRPSEKMLQRELEYGYGGSRRTPKEIAARRERPPNPLPHPAWLVWAGWDPVELSGVLAYLRAGQEWIQFRGWSYCRFECGIAPSALGDRHLTDGVWVWPEGLAHYVEKHFVRLPDEFIDHMRSQGWRVPAEPITRWADRAKADRPTVDVTFWIDWSRRMSLGSS